MNLGICLAMAGLSFNNVTESDFSPDKIHTDVRIMDQIKRTVDEVRGLYFNPPLYPVQGEVWGGYFRA
ncbi:hypothetical protein DSUL_150067 [Desulfovibrionales bacterium]